MPGQGTSDSNGIGKWSVPEPEAKQNTKRAEKEELLEDSLELGQARWC